MTRALCLLNNRTYRVSVQESDEKRVELCVLRRRRCCRELVRRVYGSSSCSSSGGGWGTVTNGGCNSHFNQTNSLLWNSLFVEQMFKIHRKGN